MKKIITLMILLFTIVSYSQNKILDIYNISTISYIEDLSTTTNPDILNSYGKITITEDNIQINIEDKINMMLVVVSEIQEINYNGRETLYCRALLDNTIHVDLVLIDDQSMFINYDDNSSLAILFE